MGKCLRQGPVLLIALLLAALLPAATAVGGDRGQPAAKAECKNGGWQNYPNAGFRNQGDCVSFVETGKFVCRDPLGCVSYGGEDPLRLATALATSGPLSLLGLDELRAVELALDSHGPVLGRAVELRNEDSMCSPEGGAAAATAIVGDPTIAAVVGTTCSVAALEAAPIISAAGFSMVSPSNTSPQLTDPDTHSAGYLRVSYNDRDHAVAMAGFVFGEGATTSAVVVDGDSPVELGEAFVAAFEVLGGVNVAFEVAEPDGSDVAAVVDALVTAGPFDLLYMPVFDPLGSALVTEVRATPALDETRLAATDALATQGFVDGLGSDAEGMLFPVPDLAFMDTPEYAAFAAAYLAEYLEEPLTMFAAYGFDAADVIVAAIEGSGIVDGVGTLHIGRQALRDALFATAGFAGLTGTITCDPQGQCGTTGFDFLTVDDGELVPVP